MDDKSNLSSLSANGDFDILASAADHDFMLMQINSTREIQELLWNKIRIQWQKLSPVITLGFYDESEFFSDPSTLVFQERIYEYRYFSLPFSLDKLFKAISEMQPIYDKKTMDFKQKPGILCYRLWIFNWYCWIFCFQDKDSRVGQCLIRIKKSNPTCR